MGFLQNLERAVRAPANALIRSVPGGSAAIAAANAVKPLVHPNAAVQAAGNVARQAASGAAAALSTGAKGTAKNTPAGQAPPAPKATPGQAAESFMDRYKVPLIALGVGAGLFLLARRF